MFPAVPMAEKSQASLNLPLDIVYDILLCLPVKKLSMFKCVCKPWCSIISSHLFQQTLQRRLPLLLKTRYQYREGIVTLHLSTYTNSGEVLITNFTITAPSAPGSYEHYKRTVPIQSCRGLVCINGWSPAPILLCNPSTEELLVLPPPEFDGGYSVSTGLGYAEMTNEFKVVTFFDDNLKCRCKVFTLGSNKGWREVRGPPYYFLSGPAPFLHGALHLLSSAWPLTAPSYIGAFDVESEEFRGVQILLPQDLLKKENIQRIMELTMLGGELCLVVHPTYREDELTLWLLKDYQNGKWVKSYEIPVTSIDRPRYWPAVRVKPLVIMNDGSILLSLSCPKEEEVVCYDPIHKVVTQKMEEVKEGNCSAGFCEQSFCRLR